MPIATTTRRRTLSILAAAALGLGACGRGPAVLPADPPGVVPAGEGAFPDSVRKAAALAREKLLAQLASRFGRELDVLHRRIDSDADPLPVQQHYERALVGAQGWRDFPLAPIDGAWAFAFASPDGRSVLAVVVLNPRFAPEGGGEVPLAILTNLPASGRG